MNTAGFTQTSGVEEILFLRTGGQPAAAELFSRYQDRLERIVAFRLDRRLLGRIDVADVLQDAYIEIARRIDDFLTAPEVSFFVWARQITWQTLLNAHRRHLGQKRNPDREVRMHQVGRGDETSVSISQVLVGKLTTPSRAAIRQEEAARLRAALETVDPLDREVLALRHFEQLTNREVAEVLDINPTAASNRYVRALKRLADILSAMTGFSDSVLFGPGHDA